MPSAGFFGPPVNKMSEILTKYAGVLIVDV